MAFSMWLVTEKWSHEPMRCYFHSTDFLHRCSGGISSLFWVSALVERPDTVERVSATSNSSPNDQSTRQALSTQKYRNRRSSYDARRGVTKQFAQAIGKSRK